LRYFEQKGREEYTSTITMGVFIHITTSYSFEKNENPIYFHQPTSSHRRYIMILPSVGDNVFWNGDVYIVEQITTTCDSGDMLVLKHNSRDITVIISPDDVTLLDPESNVISLDPLRPIREARRVQARRLLERLRKTTEDDSHDE
jgi:hypothetical protein